LSITAVTFLGLPARLWLHEGGNLSGPGARGNGRSVPGPRRVKWIGKSSLATASDALLSAQLPVGVRWSRACPSLRS
jgi:hypothetical protein